ncbi:MAG: hypothetical protein N2114_01020 [Candidatus Goldbacteria bacterium]|nr:hypothetical protein [Candidatus Goldiibacteriota bacterium]
MDKMFILYIFLGIIGAFLLSIGLAYIFALISSPYIVKSWVDRFFKIITFIPESLRIGPEYVIRKIMYFINWTNRSFGIYGEDGGQRVTGTIIYTFVTLLSIFASFLILTVTFDAIFGDGSSKVLEYLPEYLNIEIVMAAELICASILFGLALFDLLGVTDLHMFFSPKRISINTRYVLGGFTALCLVVCIWLFGLTGNIRYYGANIGATTQSIAQEATASDSYKPELPEDTEDEVPPAYARSVKALMDFVPMIAIVATAYGFTGCLPILNVIIIGVVFIVTMVLFGPVWLIGYLTDGVTLRVCEFLKAKFYMIIEYVESKKKDKKTEYVPSVPAIPVNGDGRIRKEQDIPINL